MSRKLLGFDGPDGSGKTTTARQLAELTGSEYIYFSQNNIFGAIRNEADKLSPEERFAFYLSMNLMNHPRLTKLKQNGVSTIVMDRTPLSTFAFHEVMGINLAPYESIRKHLVNQFDGICYLFASPETTKARIISRLGDGQMHKFDEFSVTFQNEIHKAFLSMLPSNAIVIDTSDLDIESAVRHTHYRLNQADFFQYE